jgi:hypothetical protein
MQDTTRSNVTVGVLGFLGGFILQVLILGIFHMDPFDSGFLLLLPGVPAFIMTLYRPRHLWIWLIVSTLTLPLAGLVSMEFILSRALMTRMFFTVMKYLFIESFVMSLIGVLLGWGIRKLIQLVHNHQQVA